jgi:hypothetical protein
MRRLSSTWLDGQEIRKDAGGLGRVIAGPAIGEVIMKLAATELVCKSGHETTLADAPDNGRCATCKAKLAVKGAFPHVPGSWHLKEDEDEDIDTEKDRGDVDEGDMTPEERKQRGVAARKTAMIAVEMKRLAKLYHGTGSQIEKQARHNVEQTSRSSIDRPRTWQG